MSLRNFVLRFLSLVTLAVWLGGFTFYGAVVIPALHEAMEARDAGEITRRVTVTLNGIGAVALAAWWVLAVVERLQGRPPRERTRIGLLAVSSALLVVLIVLHRAMDRRLDTVGLRGFYPLHRAYLIASTAQWLANLGLLALWAGAGTPPGDPTPRPGSDLREERHRDH